MPALLSKTLLSSQRSRQCGALLPRSGNPFFHRGSPKAAAPPRHFQMFKLVLEKAEEPEIRLPTSAGSWKKQESSRKTSISALLTMPKPLTVWITINCARLKLYPSDIRAHHSQTPTPVYLQVWFLASLIAQSVKQREMFFWNSLAFTIIQRMLAI